MNNFIIFILIFVTLICSSQSLEAINISRDSGMSVLTKFSSHLADQSETDKNVSQNQTNQTQTNVSIDRAPTDLWSWGKVPIGYELDKNGSLIRLADQEWKPSI